MNPLILIRGNEGRRHHHIVWKRFMRILDKTTKPTSALKLREWKNGLDWLDWSFRISVESHSRPNSSGSGATDANCLVHVPGAGSSALRACSNRAIRLDGEDGPSATPRASHDETSSPVSRDHHEACHSQQSSLWLSLLLSVMSNPIAC